MKSAMPVGPRQLLQDRFTALSTDLENLFAQSREQTRRDFAEQINQAVRRLRIAPDEDELCATLADSAVRFSSGALLFRINDEVARNPRIDVPLSSAPALASAVGGQDPVVTLAIAAEVSAPLVELLGHESDTRAHIFPIVQRDAVPAVLYAWGEVQGPALELLTQVAGAVWAAMPEPEPEPVFISELVTISPPPAPARRASTWDELPAAEQEIHLRAQRFARVQVAEMRLLHGETIQSGRVRHNLYDALREPIDTAREAFRKRFFSCPSMVDYLDLELTRTLANEDPALLGHSYPGPLI
jgi:hypothetical protein